MENKEDKITFRHLIERVKDFVSFLFGKSLWIIAGAIVFTLILCANNYLKKPSYLAKTTFVLENDTGGGLGQLSSLASLAGVNLGGLADDNSLFQIDNIQELYRSRRMIEEALLSPSKSNSKLLIDLYLDESGLRRKLAARLTLEELNFQKSRAFFSRNQDSVLMILTEEIRKENLFVSRPDRKLSILDVSVRHSNELFAKDFDEALVKHVNSFFVQTKTKKIRENLGVLQTQTDSVRQLLDGKLLELAQLTENTPNANPLLVTSRVPIQKVSIDVQAASAVYAEMVKNLEVTKLSLRNRTPLIQIIDEPIYPLEDNVWSLFKVIVIGIFSGAFITILFFCLKYFYRLALTIE